MDTATRNQSQRDTPARYAHIPGWGADLDHADRPAYPMERMPARLEGDHQHEPVRQEQDVEVLMSNERPAMTPLFGTTLPPSGLSGMLRRLAFRFSENDVRHWMTLLFADRVNVLEGLGSDLKKGRIPNVFAEMGGRAELKHNRPAFVTKVAVASTVGVLLVLWMRSRRR